MIEAIIWKAVKLPKYLTSLKGVCSLRAVSDSQRLTT